MQLIEPVWLQEDNLTLTANLTQKEILIKLYSADAIRATFRSCIVDINFEFRYTANKTDFQYQKIGIKSDDCEVEALERSIKITTT